MSKLMRVIRSLSEPRPLEPTDLLIEEQRVFDETINSNGIFGINQTDLPLVNVSLSLSRIIAKMSDRSLDYNKDWVEVKRIRSKEIAPDIAIARTQLVNWLGAEAIEKYGGYTELMPLRPRNLMEKQQMDNGFVMSRDQTIESNGLISGYLAKEYEIGAIVVAAAELHSAATRIALNQYVDLVEVHKERLEELKARSS